MYTRSAMGMPGSEAVLEKLMCRILGDLLEEDVVKKIADDLYCLGDTLSELLHNWEKDLQNLDKCALSFSAFKMIILF